jgi:thioredoxin reductase (NADPH)
LELDGVFVYIGLTPDSSLVEGMVELEPNGGVIAFGTMMTRLPGLFATLDVRAGSTKLAASAAGEGASAALMIKGYLQTAG